MPKKITNENENENKKKQYETGHYKLLESLDRLIAAAQTLDQDRLDPPEDLTINALQMRQTAANLLQNAIGNARADWRTVALVRAKDIEKFAPLAVEAVAALESRGASAETIEDARTYVRKLHGKRAKPKAKDDPATPELDESEKGISASQQSAAAQLATMNELIDFLDAQPEYANVKKAKLLVPAMRAFVNGTQTNHTGSITAAASLTTARNERNKDFYLDEDNICDLAKRYKALVKGEYGANSPEYKMINEINFIKIKS
ncbi:MAG TPA: hypothetical protein PKY59_06095 [Pyrinomonadaceae bacterium]|nr:hypothetical protein [Pyrinomonadaceae bacterium]